MTGLDYTKLLPELKVQHYINILGLTGVIDYSYMQVAWSLQIYKSKGLRLQHTSIARKPTNGTMNLPSHTNQSNKCNY